MRGLITLTGLLLVVKFVENISGELIHKHTGGSVTFDGPSSDKSLVHCSAEHNGINYSIYPEFNLTGAEFGGSSRYCRVVIRGLNLDHAGVWKIKTVWTSNKFNEFTISTQNSELFYNNYTVRVEQTEQEILPVKTIDAENGTYATVYFKDYFDNITKCWIEREHNEEIRYILSDNVNGTSGELQLYGKCGIRMTINDTWAGSWKLVQESDNQLKSGSFKIKLHPKIKSSEQLYETWRRGSTHVTITINEFSKNTYCELERPDGQVISLINSNCKYSVGKVSDKHAGIWKTRYAPEFSMNIVEQIIIVNVVDPQEINVTVTTTNDNMIHILCQTYVDAIEYCLFTTPNGTMINALPGNGNEKYMYYGVGYNAIPKEDFAQCGITILEPSNNDYGLWKCTTKDKEVNEIISELVWITHPAGKKIEHPHVTTKNVYVKRSDNFSIECTTTTSLDYCWLRSPNGTNYSVTKNRGNSQNSLTYVGEGLSVGVCGATIENADDTHSGDWSCRLGVTGGAEIESIVTVTVTDSYIAPVQKSINIAYNIPKLVVNILPSKEATIQYCRWISPNGHGFYEEDSIKYLRSENETSCTLILTDWDSTDLGTWSCYARLSTGSDEEVHANIQVLFESQNGSYTTLNIFSICLLTIIIIGSIIFGFIFYKKRIILIKNSSLNYNEFDPSKSGAITMKENPNI